VAVVVVGRLAVSLEKEGFEGYSIYDVMFPLVRLGQSTQTSFKANFALQPNAEAVILEATFTLQEEKLAGFRIACNDVTITREFKPLSCNILEGHGYICKVLYDVTPIVRSKHSESLNVVVENYGMATATLEHLAVLGLYRREGARTTIRYYSGVVLLEPGESIRLDRLPGSGDVEANIVALLPQSGAKLLVNGREFNGSGFTHFSLKLGDVNIIEVGYSSDANVFPKKAALLSIVLSKGYVPRPNIHVSASRISLSKISVVIKNEGAAPAENVVAVSINKGRILERRIVKKLDTGDEATLTLKAVEEPTVVRVIWRELGEIKVKEIRI
jgi:hypothetical protein